MNIQIFGARKSFDTKKAERWFKERRIKYQYIDLDSKGLSPGEYRSIRAAVGYDALVDRDSPDYRELGIDYLLPQAAAEKLLEIMELDAAAATKEADINGADGICKRYKETDINDADAYARGIKRSI